MRGILGIALAATVAATLAGCANDADDRALVGAAIGAPTGALVGGLATRNATGALVGAAVGGAGGAVLGAATAPPPDYSDVDKGRVPYPGYGYRAAGAYGPAYAYYDGHIIGPPSNLYRQPPRCLQEGYDPYGRVYCLRFDYPYDAPHYR